MKFDSPSDFYNRKRINDLEREIEVIYKNLDKATQPDVRSRLRLMLDERQVEYRERFGSDYRRKNGVDRSV